MPFSDKKIKQILRKRTTQTGLNKQKSKTSVCQNKPNQCADIAAVSSDDEINARNDSTSLIVMMCRDGGTAEASKSQLRGRHSVVIEC